MSAPIHPSAESFLGIHGTALALREQRLQLLAANLANADTPGFKAQDLDFNAALRAAARHAPPQAPCYRGALTPAPPPSQ
jgi:flagellar basal-body rod protein FlgB